MHPSRYPNNENNTASFILGANFKDTTELDANFKANITLKKLYHGAFNDAQCVFWDTANEEWSTKGVVKIVETDEYVICQTQHLTSFSVLMTRDDSFIPSTHKFILDFISIGGCGVSCVCLLLTIVGLMRFSHIRKMTDSKVHVNFSAALFTALLIFLVFIDLPRGTIACKAGKFAEFKYTSF